MVYSREFTVFSFTVDTCPLEKHAILRGRMFPIGNVPPSRVKAEFNANFQFAFIGDALALPDSLTL